MEKSRTNNNIVKFLIKSDFGIDQAANITAFAVWMSTKTIKSKRR